MADEPQPPEHPMEQPPAGNPALDSTTSKTESDTMPPVIMVRSVESAPEQRPMVVVQRGTPRVRNPEPVGGVELPQWIGPAISHLTTFIRNLDKSSDEMTPAEKTELEIKERAKEDAKTQRQSNQLIFYTVVTFLAILLVIIGMALDKDSIVSDIVKVGIGGVFGGAGGYGLGISKAKEKEDR